METLRFHSSDWIETLCKVGLVYETVCGLHPGKRCTYVIDECLFGKSAFIRCCCCCCWSKTNTSLPPLTFCVQVVRAKERLEEELNIQSQEQERQKNAETWSMKWSLPRLSPSQTSVNYILIKIFSLFLNADFVTFYFKWYIEIDECYEWDCGWCIALQVMSRVGAVIRSYMMFYYLIVFMSHFSCCGMK